MRPVRAMHSYPGSLNRIARTLILMREQKRSRSPTSTSGHGWDRFDWSNLSPGLSGTPVRRCGSRIRVALAKLEAHRGYGSRVEVVHGASWCTRPGRPRGVICTSHRRDDLDRRTGGA